MPFGWPMEADPSRTTWMTLRRTVERLPQAKRWLVGLALFLAASALAIALFTFGRYVFLTRLDLNDWESLQLARSFQDELFVLRYAEVFRPWSHLIFRGSYLLFGLETRPLATFFFSMNVAGAVVVFLILRDCRVQPWMAFIAALAGFFSRANYETANFLACNEPVLGRFWAAAIVLALLRARGQKSIVPLLALLGGVGAHEIWVASLPLYLCCVWFRDGGSGLRDLRHQPGMRQFTVAFAALLLLRGLLYLQAPKSFHALSAQSLGTNVVYFLSTLVQQLFQGPGLLVTPVGLIALVAVGRSASSPRALLAPNSPTRLLVFGFAWAVMGYGPHFAAASYRTTYYFCLSSFGAGLIGATFASVILDKFSGTARLVSAALIPVLFVDPRVAAMTARVTTAGELVHPFAASAREAAGDRPARLYFIEDERTLNGHWGSTFSAALSGQRHAGPQLSGPAPTLSVSATGPPPLAVLTAWRAGAPGDRAGSRGRFSARAARPLRRL